MHSHLHHSIVKIEDKKKEELLDFHNVSIETVQQVGKMRGYLKQIESQTDVIKENYSSAIKKVKTKFNIY